MMRGFIAFLACAACIVLAAVFCTQAAEGDAQSPLVYRLKCTETFNAGQPVNIGFSLENLTDETLWVLKWLTPLEGIHGRIFKVTCSGQEIPYEGPLVSRIGPFKSDYVRIGPRGSVSSQVDLSAVYRLPTGKECMVSFSGRILDVRRGETLIPDKSVIAASMEIPGNSITIRIISQN
jgi:hypothetical protein